MHTECISVVRFLAAVPAAAAAGALTAMAPVGRPRAGQWLPAPAGDGSAQAQKPGKVIAVTADCVMDAAVRLATAAGAQAWRDAMGGLIVYADLGSKPLLDGVPFGRLAGGPPSVLITTAVDTWADANAGVPLSHPYQSQATLSVILAQTRITTVALADVVVDFVCRVTLL